MLKKILATFLFITLAFSNVFCMGAMALETATVEAQATVTNRNVEITGNIIGSDTKHQVGLIVGLENDIIHIDQTVSKDDGTFSFVFEIDENHRKDEYHYQITCDGNVSQFIGTFIIDKPVKVLAHAFVSDQNVEISGNIYGTEQKHEVGLLVTKEDDILYIDQTVSAEDGSFIFKFPIDEEVGCGVFEYMITCDADAFSFLNTFEIKEKVNSSAREIVHAYFNIFINGTVPEVHGVILVDSGKVIDMEVLNKTDGTVVLGDLISSNTGTYNMLFSLPSLLNQKDYSAKITCADNEGELINLTFDISATMLLLSGTVKIKTAENIYVDAYVESNSISNLNKNFRIRNSINWSVNLPSILTGTGISVSLTGYEENVPDIPYDVYEVTGQKDDEIFVAVNGHGVSDFIVNPYTVQYNPYKLELVTPTAQSFTPVHRIGEVGNLFIVSNAPGKLVFRYKEPTYPFSGVWYGAITVLKFKLLSDITTPEKITVERR